MIGSKYLLAAALVAAPALTQAAETVYSFDSVTGIEHRQQEVLVTGVVVGDSAPTTITLPWSTTELHPYNRCDQLFNVVLNQSGAYRLIVVTDIKTIFEGPGIPRDVLYFKRCAAELKP